MPRQAVWAIAVMLACLSSVAHAVNEPVKLTPKIQVPGFGKFNAASTTAYVTHQQLATDNPALRQFQNLMKYPGASGFDAAPRELPDKPYILFGLIQEHRILRTLRESFRSKIGAAGLGREGYIIDCSASRLLITAEKPAGLYYAVKTLSEIEDPISGGPVFPVTKIIDYPTMERRGMHTLMRGKADLKAVEELITKHLPARRMNELILEINYFFQFKSHREVAESGALIVEDCRNLADLAARNHIRITPMINCLGHQSWARETFPLLAKHPEFDETPDLPKDNPGIYCRSWCPSNPNVHDFVADLCEELIDAFVANSFNVGMDEVFILGECPRCKGKPNSELFAKAVNDLHRRLVNGRKVEMQMWGDRLLDSQTTKYSKWESSDNDTAHAIDIIPRDIVICDWHYGVLKDYPSVNLFIDKGFRVWPAGWDSAENARNLASTGLRTNREKMIGYLATTWLGAEKTVKALLGDTDALKTPTAGGTKGARGIREAVDEGARISWEGIRTQ